MHDRPYNAGKRRGPALIETVRIQYIRSVFFQRPMLGAHRDWGSLLREPAALRFFVSKSPFLSFVFHVFRRIETDYWRWPRYVSLLPVYPVHKWSDSPDPWTPQYRIEGGHWFRRFYNSLRGLMTSIMELRSTLSSSTTTC